MPQTTSVTKKTCRLLEKFVVCRENKGQTSVKYSRSGRYVLLLCFVNALNSSLQRWRMRWKKSTKVIMLKPVLQRHEDMLQRTRGCYGKKSVYHTSVLNQGQIWRALGDWIAYLFSFSPGLPNHIWQRHFAGMKLFSNVLRSRPGLLLYCLPWCLPFLTNKHDIFEGENT